MEHIMSLLGFLKKTQHFLQNIITFVADVVGEEVHSSKVMPWTLINVGSISQCQYLHQSFAISNNVLSVLGHRLHPFNCGAITRISTVLLTLLIILFNPHLYVSAQGLFICWLFSFFCGRIMFANYIFE